MNLDEFLELDLKEKFRKDVLESRDPRDIDSGTTRETYGVNALPIIKDIIKRDGFRTLSHKYQQRLIDGLCQQCGAKEVYCGYVDLGGPDFYDNSWHICLSCLDAKHAEIFSSRQSGSVNCWFCCYPWD